MGFYGNITNVNKSTFQFDKTYPNRYTMDMEAKKDGIFVGRYVLVDYDESSSMASLADRIEEEYGIDIGSTNFAIGYKRMILDESSGSYTEQLDENNQIIIQPSVSEDPNANYYMFTEESANYDNYVCEGSVILVIGQVKISQHAKYALWDEFKTYEKDEKIEYKGSIYQSTTAGNVGNIPGESPVWILQEESNSVVTESTLDLNQPNELYQVIKGSKEVTDYSVATAWDPGVDEPALDEEGQPVLDENDEPVINHIPTLYYTDDLVYILNENEEKILYKSLIDDNAGAPGMDEEHWERQEWPILIVHYAIMRLLEEVPDTINPKSKYASNYAFDAMKYANIGRGWDSTVWQKTYKDGEYQYVMIAELNSVVPTFDITTDAPTETPLKPHYDSDNSNVYYKIHFQPSWGMRIKSANNNWNNSYSSDDKKYPSDVTGRFVIDSKATPQYNETGVNHHVIDKKVENVPLAVYFDQASFNKYRDKEPAKTEQKDSIGNINYIDTVDEIKLTPTGYSNNVYYAHATYENGVLVDDGSEVAPTKYPDTYELSMMLPSIGQSISKMWDSVYGRGLIKDSYNNYLLDESTLEFADEENDVYIRNIDHRWNSLSGNRISVLMQDFDEQNDFAEMDNLASTINTAHDLIGMDYRPLVSYKVINQGDGKVTVESWASHVDEADPTKIYYKDGRFYKKEKAYSYSEPISNENIDSELNQDLYVKVAEKDELVDIHSGNYYRKDLAMTPVYSDLLDEEKRNRLSNKVYWNYVKVSENDPVYDGATYGTVTPNKEISLNSDYAPGTVYKKSKTPGGLDCFELDLSVIPSEPSGEYYDITETAVSSEEKFYYKDVYFVGINDDPAVSSDWLEKMNSIETLDAEIKECTRRYETALATDASEEEIQSIEEELSSKKITYQSLVSQITTEDFTQLRLCSEETYQEVLANLESEGIRPTNYKFFEGVKVLPNPGGAQWIEDKDNPILRKGLPLTNLDNGYTEENGNYSITVWYTLDEEGFAINLNTDPAKVPGTEEEKFSFTETIPSSYVKGTTYNAPIYSCKTSEDEEVNELNGYTLLEILATYSNEEITYKYKVDMDGNSFNQVFNLVKQPLPATYTFDENTKIVKLKGLDLEVDNYYFYLEDYDEDTYTTYNKHKYWVKETARSLSTESGQKRLLENKYFVLNGTTENSKKLYYTPDQDIYFEHDFTKDYVKETALSVKPSMQIYGWVTDINGKKTAITKEQANRLDPSEYELNEKDYRQYYSEINFTPIPEEKVFVPNKYYYCMEENEENYEGVKHYALADSLDHKAFYVRNPICVVESGKNLIPIGSEWNEQVQPIPTDIKLARRVESWELKEIPEYSTFLNTFNGQILNINNIVRPNDSLVRNVATVQGAINTLNDIIARFDGLKPAEIVMVDTYGRIHSGDWDTKQAFGYTDIGRRNQDLSVPTDVVDEDNERWIKLTTISGEAEGFKPHIKIEHQFNPVDPTFTQSNLNKDEAYVHSGDDVDEGLNNTETDVIKNTLDLYTPIVDNMGHVVGSNTETVTLPYGFKYINIGAPISDELTSDELAAAGRLRADNTQDEFTINPSNKWIRIAGTDSEENGELITIGHEIHEINEDSNGISDFNGGTYEELPSGTDSINIPDWLYDDAGHIIEKHDHHYMLPYGYKSFTDSEATAGISTASNSQDTFVFEGDNWIKPVVTNDKLKINHISPVAVAQRNRDDLTPGFGEEFGIEDWKFDDKGHEYHDSNGVESHNIRIPGLELVTDNSEGNVLVGLSYSYNISSHNGVFTRSFNNIGALGLTGYNLPASPGLDQITILNSAINNTDSLNQGLEKLEYRLNKEISDRTTAINTEIDDRNTKVETEINGLNAVANAVVTEIDGNITRQPENNGVFVLQSVTETAGELSNMVAVEVDPAGSAKSAEDNAKAYVDSVVESLMEKIEELETRLLQLEPKHTVTYQWSGTAPTSVTLPQDNNQYQYGDEVVPVALENTTTEDETGTWTFNGWTPESAVVKFDNITFTGSWSFIPKSE